MDTQITREEEGKTFFRIGVDIGGTFTDTIVLNEATGEILTSKVETTPGDPSVGFLNAIKKVLPDLTKVTLIVHSGTVATNTVVTRSGAKVGLVTTKGFRDVLEIQRGNRKHSYDLRWVKPEPLAPRYLRMEVPERVDSSGAIVEPLDEEKARQVARALRKEAEAVAVCFMFSFMNPKHELRMKEILQEEMPEAYVDTSYEVAPEYREYERANTVVINAYVKPKMKKYLESLVSNLKRLGYGRDLLVMHSGGGVTTAQRAAEKPVLTISSGPAAGVVAGAHLGSLIGVENLITLDMGGTTTLVSCVHQGKPKFTSEGEVEWGLPVKAPMVDVVIIGNGGGSTAWVDAGRTLRVGPQSAAAYPGPACYGKGGKQPTITDANLLLRFLNAEYFLGGEMKLHTDLARSAVKQIAEELNMSEIEAAYGIRTIASANMEQAIRAVTVERGYDPRDFALIAFGGAGPMFAADVARDLSIPKVIVPPNPGLNSALGVLLTDIRYDYSRSLIATLRSTSLTTVNQIFSEMENQGKDDLAREGFTQNIAFHRSLDLRYVGESYEVNVPVRKSTGGLEQKDVDAAVELFHEEHQKLYGHATPSEPVELVNLRLFATTSISKLQLKQSEESGGRPDSSALKDQRDVFFEKDQSTVTPIYERKLLKPGNMIDGPALVEQMDSTLVLPPGARMRVDRFLNILIDTR